MTSLLPLLEYLPAGQDFLAVVGVLTFYSLTRHIVPKLIEKGPDYIEQFTAYKVAMAALKPTTPPAHGSADAPLIFPSRANRPENLEDGERRAA